MRLLFVMVFLCPVAVQAKVVDFNVVLTGLDGLAITDPTSKEPITLGDVAVVSLITMTDTDRQIEAKAKYDWAELARKIYKKKADITAEDAALIKQRVGKIYGPLVVKQTWDLLEQKPSE